MWRSFVTAAAVVLTLAACRSGGGLNRARSQPDLLTTEQIQATHHSTAYDVVRSLRPNWLNVRGPDSFRSPGQIQVYVDDMRLGGVDQLRTLPTSGITSIRWYDGISAAGRWGLDHGNGVIYVSMAPG